MPNQTDQIVSEVARVLSRNRVEPWFYAGEAFNTELDRIVLIGMLAYDAVDAYQKYSECIQRHPELQAIVDHYIGEMLDPEGIVDERFTPEQRAEWDEFHSVEL